jgi:hypothetical protein
MFQLSLLLLLGLLLTCSYRPLIIPGVPALAAVSAVAASLLLLHEVYSATGVSNIPGVPAVVGSLMFLPSLLYWLMLVIILLLCSCCSIKKSHYTIRLSDYDYRTTRAGLKIIGLTQKIGQKICQTSVVSGALDS